MGESGILIMQQTLDIFILGESEGTPDSLTVPSIPMQLRLIPTGVRTFAEFPATRWAMQLSEGEGELAGLAVDSNDSLHELGFEISNDWIQNDWIRANQAAKVLIERIDGSGYTLDPINSIGIGHGIRVLLAPRTGYRLVVFRRGSFKAVGLLRPAGDPIWDWLIRAVRAGEQIGTWGAFSTLQSPTCRLPMLAPARPGIEASWLMEHLNGFSPKEFGLSPRSKATETALRAGLFQWHDFLDESHQMSQSIEGEGEDRLGDYWHAIMHRREPDFSNAKYWFRQIGTHRIFAKLGKEADATLAKLIDPAAARWRERLQRASKWDPFAFVDLCEACAADETTELALAARRIQYIEMSELMSMTCGQCGGGGHRAESIALAAKRA
jgi:hypothetical protein